MEDDGKQAKWSRVQRCMLNPEDEDMPDAPDTPAEPAETAAGEPAPEEPKPVEKPEPKQELKEEVSVQGGRRRGKRQVMKKKTVKDEEGYLGMHPDVCPVVQSRLTISPQQSPWRSQSGSRSRRMSLRRRPRRSRHLAGHPRVKAVRRMGRVASCLSLRRKHDNSCGTSHYAFI